MADESYPMKIAGGVYISCGSRLNSFPVVVAVKPKKQRFPFDFAGFGKLLRRTVWDAF